jgi:Flp pilus assembly protein TadG
MSLSRMRKHFTFALGLHEQTASSLVELAVALPVLIMLLVGAIDFGHGFYLALEVSSAAEAAALFGVQNPTDTAGITNLAKLNAQDVTNLNVATVSGCECSDGTSASTDCTSLFFCSANIVRYVEVTVTGTFVPILSFPGVNTNISLKAHQKMRSTVGP